MTRLRWMTVVVLLLSAAGCRSGIDLSTDEGQMRFGVQAARMDLWREAQFRFLRAVEMNPQDPMAYNNLAVAYEGIGEYEKAREAYLRALQIDRSNQYIQRNYSRFVEFYSKRNPEEEGEEGDAEEKDASDEPSVQESDPDEPAVPEDAPDEPSDPDEPAVPEDAPDEPSDPDEQDDPSDQENVQEGESR